MNNKHNKGNMSSDFSTTKKYSLACNPFNINACTSLDQYVERENEINDFKNDLNMVSFSGCKGKKIIGSKGIGKTSLVNMYFEVAHQHNLKTVYVTVPNTAQKFMQKLLAAAINAETDVVKRTDLGKKHGEYVQKKSAYPDDIFRKFTEVIDKLQPKPVIVALDETDNLPRMPQITHLFNNYIFDHANDVMFILCMLPGAYKKIIEGMGAFADRFPSIIRLPCFSNKELLCVFEKRLISVRTKTVSDPYYPFSKKAVKTLLEHAGGVPRYLIEIADTSLRIGAESQLPLINENIIDQAAVRAERGYLVDTWESLNVSEKQLLIEIVNSDDKNIKIDDMIPKIKKDRSVIWRCVNALVERGLVERQGEQKKDVTYRLITDPKLILDLKNMEMKTT